MEGTSSRYHGKKTIFCCQTASYQLSLNWLCGLLHCFYQLPTILQQYDNVIQNQINKAMIKPVEDLEYSYTQ